MLKLQLIGNKARESSAMKRGQKQSAALRRGLHFGSELNRLREERRTVWRAVYVGPQPPAGELVLAATPTPTPTGCEVKFL